MEQEADAGLFGDEEVEVEEVEQAEDEVKGVEGEEVEQAEDEVEGVEDEEVEQAEDEVKERRLNKLRMKSAANAANARKQYCPIRIVHRVFMSL